MITFEDLKSGLSPSDAIAAFRAGCNTGSDRLWITDTWFGPREQRLRAALPDPITQDIANALREAVLKTRHLDLVIGWLENGAKPWPEYEQWRAEENRRRAVEQMREGYFPWEDVDACRGRKTRSPKPVGHASACPQCATPPEKLTWIYFHSPEWTWQHLCGRAGWMTVCDTCHLQTGFFLEIMN
jgi:hypothetical protein